MLLNTIKWFNLSTFVLVLLVKISKVQLQLIHLAPTPSNDCARCICEQAQSCDSKICEVGALPETIYNDTNSNNCGPFNLSLGLWKSWGQKRLRSDATSDEITAFKNCATDYDCSAAVIINYTSNGSGDVQDCDNDNEFTCTDIFRIFILGPQKCTNAILDMSPQYNISQIAACYSRRLEHSSEEDQPAKNPIGTIVGVVGGILFLIALLILFYCKFGLQDSDLKTLNQKKTLKTDEKSLALRLPLTAIIPPDELTIDKGKFLGEGQFGNVYEGEYNSMRVAVKAPKLSFVMDSLEEFQRELEIMARIGYHENIVCFYGAEISQMSRGIAYVVLQLSPHGALLDFMRSFSQVHHHDFDESVTGNEGNGSGDQLVERLMDEESILETKLYWSEQIASGMDFLESKNVLHGDLAARNILLFDGNVVKISDFGFSRNLGNHDDYEKQEGPLPWRWLAPECLERRIFSLKSDIWAFGVTVWEIFTLGLVPFTNLENSSKAFLDELVRGFRLQKPPSMKPEIYNMLLECWDIVPDMRPSFRILIEFFASARKNIPKKSWDGNYEEICQGNRSTNKRFSISPRYSRNPC